MSAWPEPVTAALTSLGVYSLHRQPGPGGGQHRDRRGLRGAHHGADVVLAEDPLDGDRVRAVLGDQRGQRAVEGSSRCGQVGVRVGADHVDRDQPAGPAGHTLDHADAAPGQPRVDAEHPHAHLPPSYEQSFDTLPTPAPAPAPTLRHPTRLPTTAGPHPRVTAPAHQ